MTSLKESIEQLPDGKDRDDLLRNISSSPRISSSTPALTKTKLQKGRLVMAPPIWREHVQNLIHEIIVPDSLHWMDDDDDGMSVSHICRRSLQELQIRFEQWVHFPSYKPSIDIILQAFTSFYQLGIPIRIPGSSFQTTLRFSPMRSERLFLADQQQQVLDDFTLCSSIRCFIEWFQ